MRDCTKDGHCWHFTGNVLISNSKIHIQKCCVCGKLRYADKNNVEILENSICMSDRDMLKIKELMEWEISRRDH